MPYILGISPAILWLVVLIICLAIEAFTVQLVSIWFAFGALGAMLMAVLGFRMTGQLIVFAVMSLILLCALRPMAEKLLKPVKDRTNADRIFGEKAVVIQTIDNSADTGQIRVFNQTWTARSVAEGIIIPEGSTVYIDGISGVKAMVVLTPEELGGCKV